MATIAASRRSAGSRSDSSRAGRKRSSHSSRSAASGAAKGTKAQTKPDEPPQKAAKPRAAKQAGEPSKAHKPKSTGEPSTARKPTPAAKPSKAHKPKSADGPGAAKALVKAATPGSSGVTGKAKLAVAKFVARRALTSGIGALSEGSGEGMRRAVLAVGSMRDRALHAAGTTVDVEASRRPPIQAAVDVAVPCRVVWREWARLEWLPEGVDGVVDIKRKGDRLTGRLRGSDGIRWRAHILDEREEDSFAWESERGSDCAGLITFHALADRLTRIELSLDVRPVSVAQAAALSTRWADRRAAADLRRFKARLELINPDSYPDPDDHDD